jgi:hypothetical protein
MYWGKEMSWCLENDIKVYIQPIRQGKNPPVIIVINFKGKIKKGKLEYNQKDIKLWEKIKEIYSTYFSFYN